MGIDRTGPVGPFRFAGSQAEHARNAYRRQPAEQASSREDSINLSSAARDLANADPAQRDELVRRIRSQVQSGTYRVDADTVARQMVNRGDV
ncbi:MAG: flagellar biosynthesis anti-sigma factor FlgM [Dehalococcoidia bacterium]